MSDNTTPLLAASVEGEGEGEEEEVEHVDHELGRLIFQDRYPHVADDIRVQTFMRAYSALNIKKDTICRIFRIPTCVCASDDMISILGPVYAKLIDEQFKNSIMGNMMYQIFFQEDVVGRYAVTKKS